MKMYHGILGILFWICVTFVAWQGLVTIHFHYMEAAWTSCLKESFAPKFELAENPQAIQDVDEFVSSSEQIWRNVALHHLLTNESSAVNGCRQNESPNNW